MRLALILAAVVWLSGCATSYQRMGFSGGYDDERIEEGRYFVEVRVNGFTSASTAMRYLHRRAMELCRQAGYASYRLEDRQASEDTSVITNTTGSTTVSSYGGVANASHQGQSRSYVVRKPETSAVVRCVGQRPAVHAPTPRPEPVPPGPGEFSRAAPAWFCALGKGSATLGICMRTMGGCRALRARLSGAELRHTPCRERAAAYCFAYAEGGAKRHCYPTFTACFESRKLRIDKGGASVTRCRITR